VELVFTLKNNPQSGTVVITLPEQVQGFDKQGNLLEVEEYRIPKGDGSKKLAQIWEQGVVSVWVEGKRDWTGQEGQNQVSMTLGENRDELRLGPVEIIPNFDRNETIDLTGLKDRSKVTEDKPFRWWINDDSDDGDIASGDSDVPGAVTGLFEFDHRTPNHDDEVINGRCDLVDFFPLFLDIKQLMEVLPPSNAIRYKFNGVSP
jgi:hypothetical protein